MFKGESGSGSEPDRERDLGAIFDLDRTKLTKSMVDRFEQLLRDRDAVGEDLRQLAAECKDANFSKRQIAAMKRIAKLRKDDKRQAAREELSALEQVATAVGFDLFDWAGGDGA